MITRFIRTLALVALAATIAQTGPAHSQASDASKWTRPSVGFAKPPASHAEQADVVPASGIQGQVTDSQIESIDGSRVTGTVQNAATANSANSAATAQQLDPNAPVDVSNVTGIPDCTPPNFLTKVAGVFKCEMPITAKAQFDSYKAFSPGAFSWTVPDGIVKIRVQAIGGGGSSGPNAYSGGGGGYCSKTLTVSPGQVITGAVGGVAGTSSINGGCTATGGGPGTYGANSGGTGSGGDLNLTGGTGQGCFDVDIYYPGGSAAAEYKPLGTSVGGAGHGGAIGPNCATRGGQVGIVWIEF